MKQGHEISIKIERVDKLLEENKNKMQEVRLLDIHQLMVYIGLGRNKALEIGKESNSIVRIGRRVLYDKKQIDQYIDEMVDKSDNTEKEM